MCALPLPPDLQLAGDIFGSSEWCSCLCWEVDSSCTKKNMMSKAQSPKENRYPLESTIHHTTPKTTARLYLECWLKFLLCASSTTSMDLFLDQRIKQTNNIKSSLRFHGMLVSSYCRTSWNILYNCIKKSKDIRKSICKGFSRSIPHICQCWCTATLLRPVKSTPKST